MKTIAVVGANGRVGSAIAIHLTQRFTVSRITRTPGESPNALAERAAAGADVVVNAAGVAHIRTADDQAAERLRMGNVELPLALAASALVHGSDLIHISSVKALHPDESPYAESKRDGEDRLIDEFGSQFEAAGLTLTILRPLALLFPPLDAGKVARLRFLRHVPRSLLPPVRLPVLAPSTFLNAIESAVTESRAQTTRGAIVIREFAVTERGRLRDVADAF